MNFLKRLFNDFLERRSFASNRKAMALKRRIAELCSNAASLSLTKNELEQNLLVAPTKAQAQIMFRQIVLPVIDASAAHSNFSIACEAEYLAYTRLVKTFEDPEHYEFCFKLIEESMHDLGFRSRQSIPLQIDYESAPKSGKRLLFFAHNIGTEFAHLGLLSDLIDSYLTHNPQEASNIGIVGGSGKVAAASIERLQKKWGLEIFRIRGTDLMYSLYAQACGVLVNQGFDRIVFVSVPFGISFVTGLLGASRVSWLSMKFELNCFQHLQNRCSFLAGRQRSRSVKGRLWHEAPPLMDVLPALSVSSTPPPALKAARRFKTVYYTVNREEKIKNPVFLDAVADILNKVEDSAFLWTGRQRLPQIDAFFSERNLSHRHFFAGWVNPDDLLEGGDVFLDTPVLSGTVAARAAARGKPLVTFAGSHSWLNLFKEAYDQDRENEDVKALRILIDRLVQSEIFIECANISDYVKQAVKLGQNPQLSVEYGRMLSKFAEHYFFNSYDSADAHFVNLRLK